MSLLRADKIANRFNNTGPIIVGPSTVSGSFSITGITTVLGLGVTQSILVGQAVTSNYLTVNNGADIFNANLTGITTAGIVTGATYYGNGVNLTGVVTSVTPGPGVQISPVSGQGRVTISATGVAVAGYATNAGLATDVKGGVAGAVLYQAGANDTAFTAAGSAGEILQSNGTGTPTWVSLTAINVSYADSAGISTNLKGGSAGRIPVQSGVDQTSFIPVGVSGNILLAQGTSTPIFIDPKAQLDVRRAQFAGIATNLQSGYISSATSLEVIGVTTLGVATARTLDVTGITTTDLLNVGTAGTIPNLTLSNSGIAVTAILDEDDMVSNRADALATQQSIRAYVDATRTGIGLTFDADTGTGTIDLDEETFTIEGTANEIYTIGLGNTVTVGLDTNVTVPNNLVVSGFSSLSGLTTITGSLGVTGITTTQFLDVTGVSTFQGDVTLGAGVTVFNGTFDNTNLTGVTTSQFLQVTGVSTFQGDVTLGAGVTVFNGTFDNTNLTGVTTVQNLGITGITTTHALEVTGVSTFTGYVTAGTGLTVAGTGITATTLNVTGVATAQFLEVTGVSTIATLGVSGVTTSQFLEVTGVSTFQGDVTLGAGVTVFNGTFDNTNLTGVTTAQTLGVSGVTTTQFLEVTGVSTLTGYVTAGTGLTVAGTGITATTLNVTGFSTQTGFATFGSSINVANQFYAGGISSVGAAITMFPSSGIVSATAFYGDGSNLTGVVGLVSVTNILFVTPDGNDENDGYLVSTAKRTVGSALTVAEASTVIKISAGNYTENNPIVLPEQVTLLGDSLREVSLIPQNADQDMIYVANGSYVENISFTGSLNEGKAIIAFNPDKPSYVTQGPYIRNCTNFISNSIGMKIDGAHVIGDTRAMNVDSYTQLNQGGIGVSISNEGYAQLVSIFTIYNDQSIVCTKGGQCDLTNSNSSFGRLGLVADGIGPQQFIGTVTEAKSADTSVFPIDIGVDTLTITNAEYDNVTGLTTVTTSTNHGFNVGMSVTMKDMTFTCDSQLPITSFGISTANYSNVTGIMTVQTAVDNNFYVGASVTFAQLVFSCDSGGGVSTAYFPPAPGDNNGAPNHVFDVITVGTSTEFTVNVGPSTITHNYQEGGNVSISTFAPFPSGAFGNIFTVDSIVGPTTFTAYVGVSTLAHTYVSGGEAETFVTRPYDGQVVYLDELYNSIESVTITNGGSGYTTPPVVTFSSPSESWGITATGTAVLTDGVVTSVQMISNGRGYTGTPTVTIDGAATGTCNILPTYYVVSSSTPIVGGISTVTFTERVPYAVGVGSTVPFFKQSRVLASSHAFEYIGSGNTALSALPQRGGVAIAENEVISQNGGLVIYTSTDQAGNFKIGDGVIINQLEGSITGDAYQRSLFANITPYILALGGDS